MRQICSLEYQIVASLVTRVWTVDSLTACSIEIPVSNGQRNSLHVCYTHHSNSPKREKEVHFTMN